ncbi:MAG: hypothetical protein K0S09_3150 [Sphingobacteriaceae bacterium]|nr:hypothetical protein [Sphingobacteriaceae bacterium]
MYQWLQVSVKLLYSDVTTVPLNSISQFPGIPIENAFLLALASLIIQAIGINLIISKIAPVLRETVQEQVSDYDSKRLLGLYIAAIIISPVLIRLGGVAGSFQQLAVKIVTIKWSILVLLYLNIFPNNPKYRTAFLLIVSIEFLLSFTGYFSSFKEYFFLLALAALTISRKFTLTQYFGFAAAGMCLFFLSVIWQTIKPDYRKELSGGEAQQTVTISSEDALNSAYSLASEVDKEDFENGFYALIQRTSYIDFLGVVENFVPFNVPHENGALWEDAVKRIFQPRIFFPNKRIIDDSEKAMKYTGLNFAGAAQGASISLGYVTESYIDFGYLLMMIPLFLWGLVIGVVYRFIFEKTGKLILGMVLTIPIYFQIFAFETALDKIITALLYYFIVYLLLKIYGLKMLDKFLSR